MSVFGIRSLNFTGTCFIQNLVYQKLRIAIQASPFKWSFRATTANSELSVTRMTKGRGPVVLRDSLTRRYSALLAVQEQNPLPVAIAHSVADLRKTRNQGTWMRGMMVYVRMPHPTCSPGMETAQQKPKKKYVTCLYILDNLASTWIGFLIEFRENDWNLNVLIGRMIYDWRSMSQNIITADKICL